MLVLSIPCHRHQPGGHNISDVGRQDFLFISVFNQLDAKNLFHNMFYFMPLHVSSTCAQHQEVKIALHSLLYHHTYRCDKYAEMHGQPNVKIFIICKPLECCVEACLTKTYDPFILLF